MKTVCAIAAVTLLLTGFSASADDSAAVGRAKVATRSWLALADKGDDKSWDEASSLFKAAVTKAAWANSLSQVRWTLGVMKSRKVRSAAFTRTLPGAPDGQYVVMQFDSEFERKAAAVETVTSMLDKDGTWRVAGYFIK
jgi:leucyl aminopeptidase (aminopeptidase T)